MRKGFTLIEVLGVITLLALISTIVLIVVDKSLKDSKSTLSSIQIENIKSAATMWKTDNIELVPDTGYYVLTLGDLIDLGYIGDVVDINTNETYDRSIFVNVGMKDILIDNKIEENIVCDNDKTVLCIRDRSDMEKLANEVNNGDNKSGKTYKLVRNIDLGGKFDENGNPLSGNNSWTPIGNLVSESNSKPFSGTFDGNGHIITGMYIDSTSSRTGLFSVVDGGIIENIGIENSYVKSTGETTGAFVGALRNGVISNCYNKATVVGRKTSGGIAGSIRNSILKNCYNAGNVNNNNNQFAGGIAGYITGIVENCYNIGNIYCGYESGGIVGGGGEHSSTHNVYNLGSFFSSAIHGGVVGCLYSDGVIQNSYNSGNLGSTNRGGIVGNIYQTLSQQLIDNYYLNTTADYGILSSSNNNFQSNSDNGTTPLSASEMPSVLSVINGDDAFVPDTKGINNGYPILKWQQ